ncbi:MULTISPECIES: hypothetical protein [Nostoc]|uniref:Uncharacterized protein n=2 Tax=Nostoc TaxID=1177 RepID=A0ABR8I8D2_9NOSO|nr:MULTISPECIES: hypothetical protein [Nostoc]MBD2563791.1 hypothetical protein [Nostoc linckia FACHB-391]MBD2646725.1 hypothetical protein [Nostoc foliaceum FACHB-393]
MASHLPIQRSLSSLNSVCEKTLAFKADGCPVFRDGSDRLQKLVAKL